MGHVGRVDYAKPKDSLFDLNGNLEAREKDLSEMGHNSGPVKADQQLKPIKFH